MRILHLSDIHLSEQKLMSNKFLLDAFFEDLKFHNAIKKIDCVVISGDLVDKGGDIPFKGKDCYSNFETIIIEPIADILKIDKNKFFFIPGNHDIEEKYIDANYDDGFLKNTNTIEKVNSHIKDNRKAFRNGMRRVKKYKDFEKKYYSKYLNCELSNFESCFVLEMDSLKVGIAAFNSAWMCSPKIRPEKIMLGTDQIRRAQAFFIRNKTHFNIGLIHHHPDLFVDFEEKEIKTTFTNSNIDILLCGHTHENVSEKLSGNRNKIFTSVSKSSFGNPREVDSEYKSGYTLIDLSLDDEKKDISITFNYRVYVHSRESFDKDVYTAQNGRFEEKLAKKNLAAELKDFLNSQRNEDKAQLDDEWNAITSRLIKSTFPKTRKQIADIIRDKMLPDILDHYVKNMELTYEIVQYDDRHIELIEIQEFEIVSSGTEFGYDFDYNIQKTNDPSDKSDIETIELVIDGKNYLSMVAEPIEIPQKGGKEIRKQITFQLKLEGKELYKYKRITKTIHSTGLNVYWKYDIVRITDGLTIDIRNNGGYELDLLGFGSNTNLKQVSYSATEIGKLKHYDLLMPGDGFILIIKSNN